MPLRERCAHGHKPPTSHSTPTRSTMARIANFCGDHGSRGMPLHVEGYIRSRASLTPYLSRLKDKSALALPVPITHPDGEVQGEDRWPARCIVLSRLFENIRAETYSTRGRSAFKNNEKYLAHQRRNQSITFRSRPEIRQRHMEVCLIPMSMKIYGLPHSQHPSKHLPKATYRYPVIGLPCATFHSVVSHA
jgi:hypothetical protein